MSPDFLMGSGGAGLISLIIGLCVFTVGVGIIILKYNDDGGFRYEEKEVIDKKG